jgi:hypothetical protein
VESSAGPQVAGSSVLALRVFLVERLGQQGFDRVLKELPPHLSEPIAGILLPVNWYPTESYVAVLHVAPPLIGPGFYDEFGEFSADYEITMFQRILLRFTSPAAFVEHAGGCGRASTTREAGRSSPRASSSSEARCETSPWSTPLSAA